MSGNARQARFAGLGRTMGRVALVGGVAASLALGQLAPVAALAEGEAPDATKGSITINSNNYRKGELSYLGYQVFKAAVGKDGSLQLKAGALKMTVKPQEVRLIEEGERASKKKEVTIRQQASRTLRTMAAAASELDIRGMETLEAEPVVERFIDSAVMGKLNTVTIIHGKGTGALRKAVHQMLRRNPAVKGFRLGVYGEGESGVTVVELR